jgi:ankyrin repeat protein
MKRLATASDRKPPRPTDPYDEAIKAGDAERIRTLMQGGVKPPERAIYAALFWKKDFLIPLLKEAGADPDVGGTLWRAICYHPASTVEMLLRAGANPNNDSPAPPLNLAAAQSSPEPVKLLLSYGADPNKEYYTVTPLMVAVRDGQIENVQVLLDAGADPYAEDANCSDCFALAKKGGHEKVFELLKRRAAAMPKPRRKRKKTNEVLMRALHNKDKAELDRGIAAGVDLNAADRLGRTPLGLALGLEDIWFLQRLLEAGALVEADEDFLGGAVMMEKPEMIKLLLKHGAVPRKGREDPILDACRYKSMEMVEMLIDAGSDVNATNGAVTALMSAASSGRLALVELLLSHGARLEGADFNGWGILVHALSNISGGVVTQRFPSGAKVMTLNMTSDILNPGMAKIVKLLVKRGADVNARDKDGRTPITYARSKEIAELLSELGAKLDILDKRKREPAYWLAKNGVQMGASKPKSKRPPNGSRVKGRRE